MVSGGIGIIMVIKVTGGARTKIGIPFLIFQNAASSYPIRGVLDNFPGVCYRTAKKGFVIGELLTEYYKEKRISYADPGGHTKVQWMDNASRHKILPNTERAL